MALGRIKIKSGKKFHAQAHSDYIFGAGKYRSKDTTQEIKYRGVGNLPKFAENNPNFFWECADEFERKNGSTYREHELSLPRELTLEQHKSLIRDWLKKQGINTLVYQYAIHAPIASDGKPQPHCHLMFCERELDGIERPAAQFFMRHNAKNPERGGCKKRNTGLDQKQRKAQILKIRQDWGELVNDHLAKYNHTAKVDMRNWWHRGLDQKPTNLPMSFFKTIKADVKQSHESLQSHLRTLRSLRPEPELQTRLESLKAQQRAASALKIENERLAKLAEQEKQKAAQLAKERQQKTQIQAIFETNHVRPRPDDPMSRLDNLTDSQHEQFVADTIKTFGVTGALARPKLRQETQNSPEPQKDTKETRLESSSTHQQTSSQVELQAIEKPKPSPKFRP